MLPGGPLAAPPWERSVGAGWRRQPGSAAVAVPAGAVPGPLELPVFPFGAGVLRGGCAGLPRLAAADTGAAYPAAVLRQLWAAALLHRVVSVCSDWAAS